MLRDCDAEVEEISGEYTGVALHIKPLSHSPAFGIPGSFHVLQESPGNTGEAA